MLWRREAPTLRLTHIEPAVALLAPEHRALLLDAVCNVHLGADAVAAHICRVRRDAGAAEAAQHRAWQRR